MALAQQPSYREPARSVPIIAEYDVIVAGAGPAGCAAALGAARHGARVLLAEREGYLGGAATVGLISRFMSPNGKDYQGVWHQFTRAMLAHGGVRCSEKNHCNGAYDAEIIKVVWDKLMVAAGVDLLVHCHIAGAMKDGDRVTGLIVETKAGRQALKAGRVIDATGDGIVCAQAGAGFDLGADGAPWAMACSLGGRVGPIHMPEGMSMKEWRDRIESNYRAAMERKEYTSAALVYGRTSQKAKTWFLRKPPLGEEIGIGTARILEINPIDPFSITDAERRARREILEVADFYRKYVPGAENSYLIQTAAHIGVRSSRRIHGLDMMTAGDVFELRKHPDSIARGAWHVDIWPATDHVTPTINRERPEIAAMDERLQVGDYYDIRYGCVVVKGVDNLLVAGRCLSAEHEAQASLRIQQTCMATGEAAGVAAAMSLQRHATPAALTPSDVAAQLRKDRAAIEPAFPELSAV